MGNCLPPLQAVCQPTYCSSGACGARRNNVTRKKLGSYYGPLLNKSGKTLMNEYTRIEHLSEDMTYDYVESERDENYYKNRYSNVMPYDHTRVKLEQLPGDSFSDYINASYIRGYTSNKEYIAAQGPTEETCNDFWRMVWQENVKLILMLTRCQEEGKDKCYKYWPGNQACSYGGIRVELTSVVKLDGFVEQSLKVSKEGATRLVKHLQFLIWNDYGSPETTKSLLDFIKLARMYKDPDVPTLVHCSAGIGRSGTLIALDILLQQARLGNRVDIFRTVLALRECRNYMVSNLTQYAYIHYCLRDAILDTIFLSNLP